MKSKNSYVEFTLTAIGLGVLLSLLMCAANTYLGLYAGMTVSASIPAAVISMGILRGLLRRGTILENNIVQTTTSAGESLAAGIIFTIPALVITGIWNKFGYWETSIVALLGGLLGVLFMIPLRRTLIVEQKDLAYPEGVACGEVLKAGEAGGANIFHVFLGAGLGIIFKFFVSGISLIRSSVEIVARLGRFAFYFGSDMSAALIGVGYIVGFNIAFLVFLGGAIGWLFGIPIYGLVHGLPEGDLIDAFHQIWSTQIRYLGVGAMLVGGIWSIIKVRQSMIDGFKKAIFGYGESTLKTERIDQDLSHQHIKIGLLIVAIPIFILYSYLTRSVGIGIVAGFAMILAAFFFVAVSSYIVGLVGSSNNPVSGMVIVTLLFVAALLLIFGMSGTQGILASLLVAGVVCCAACTAGDISQDLKTGFIIRAMPRHQQWAQIIGVIVAAFIISPILTVLHKAYGIGTGIPGSLVAPQASLFANIANAMFTDKGLPWLIVSIGILIGVCLIFIDEILVKRKVSFRLYVMPVAVGIYLPLTLSVPILIGGVICILIKNIVSKKSDSPQRTQKAYHRGILFSSGLIAGESITGILIAMMIVSGIRLPIRLIDSSLVSIISFVMLIYILVKITTKDTTQNKI